MDTTHSLIILKSYSIMSPRSKYLHTATVLIKPSIAISNAASKYRPVPMLIPYKIINAMTFIYIVSSAKIRSGTDGPIISRHKFSNSDKPIIEKTMSNTVSSIEKSPLGELRSVV